MNPIPKRGVPLAELLRLALTRVVPAGFAVGAGMELFMVNTGFYSVATRKAAERQAETRDARRAHATVAATR